MQIVTEYPNGLFSWVDLMTTDVEGARVFYAGLFGWEVVDIPLPMGGSYTKYQIDGNDVAGMGGMSPEMIEQGVPSFWTSYVKHDDVDSVFANVAAAGGTPMMPPMDVMDEGRMAMIQDPAGAVFGVWQPKNHIGAQVVNYPNTLIWNELQTGDVAGAREFYATLFGWTYGEDESGYIAVSNDGRVQAGMMAIGEDWGPMPPNWAAYFMVEDVEAGAARAQELGGTVIVPPTSAGEMGRFAVIQDPQGAAFTIMEFNGPVDPPPGF